MPKEKERLISNKPDAMALWEQTTRSLPLHLRELTQAMMKLYPYLTIHSLASFETYNLMVEWYKRRVGGLSKRTETFFNDFGLGVLLHDIGKTMIPSFLYPNGFELFIHNNVTRDLSHLRELHPYLGEIAILLWRKKIDSREAALAEPWAFLAANHHIITGHTKQSSHPHKKDKMLRNNPWIQLAFLFAQLADSLTAMSLDRPYRPINPNTARKNIGLEKTLQQWTELLNEETLQKIFPKFNKNLITNFRTDLLQYLISLRTYIEKTFPPEVCLEGLDANCSNNGQGLIMLKKLQVLVASYIDQKRPFLLP